MLTFSSLISFSQNLIPNFSFEIYDTCPSTEDQVQYATGWSKYSASLTTPDYFNACAPEGPGSMNVPNSGGSFQPAHRNCNAYSGVITFGPLSYPNYREHIGIQINQQLIIGEHYFISFYAVMGAEKCYSGECYEMPSNNIGVRLSTIPYNGNTPCPIDNFAHINYPLILNDSINWTRISGSVIADSSYNYLIIGNFFQDVNTDTMEYNCNGCMNWLSYYLIDDICLSTDSSFCNGGIDLLPCNVYVNEISFYDEVNIIPNPASEFTTITFPNNIAKEVLLYNGFGNLLYEKKIKNENVININLSTFSQGCYLLKIIDNTISIPIYKKIVKF